MHKSNLGKSGLLFFAHHHSSTEMVKLAPLLIVMVIIALHGHGHGAVLNVKKLAGDPSEFESHRIPNPKDVTEVEKSMTQYVYFEQEGDQKRFSAQVSIPVDSPQAEDSQFAFTFASPYQEKATLTMRDPLGKEVDLRSIASKVPLLFSPLRFVAGS